MSLKPPGRPSAIHGIAIPPGAGGGPEGGPAREVERNESLLARIAARVSEFDGSRPGGALIGPRLMLMAALENAPDERLLRTGTAIELLRRATLVHRDPKRECRWEGYGAVAFSQTLRGDVMLAESFRLLAGDGDARVVDVLARAMASVAAGELVRHTADADEGECAWALQASFYEGAARAGAILGGLVPSEADIFTAWARAAGETHERGVAGEPPDAGALRDLRGRAPIGPDAFADLLVARIGSPDMLPSGL